MGRATYAFSYLSLLLLTVTIALKSTDESAMWMVLYEMIAVL